MRSIEHPRLRSQKSNASCNDFGPCPAGQRIWMVTSVSPVRGMECSLDGGRRAPSAVPAGGIADEQADDAEHDQHHADRMKDAVRQEH